jgi:hypothetical protein
MTCPTCADEVISGENLGSDGAGGAFGERQKLNSK